MAEVTQDKPIIKFLCKMQAGCEVGFGRYSCYTPSPLDRWDQFRGCNNLTLGYDSSDNRVYLESCNCGGLM